jgi:hypothetical protein
MTYFALCARHTPGYILKRKKLQHQALDLEITIPLRHIKAT